MHHSRSGLEMETDLCYEYPASRKGEGMAVLIFKDSGGRYVDFEVPTRPLRIGRSPVADVQIQDGRLSRIHCEITRNANGFIIRDLDSTNGTWVNQNRVHEARLKFGDKIRVGQTLIAFES